MTPGLNSSWNSLGRNNGVGSFSLPNPGIEPRSPAFQEDSLPTEPQRKPGFFFFEITLFLVGCAGLCCFMGFLLLWRAGATLCSSREFLSVVASVVAEHRL